MAEYSGGDAVFGGSTGALTLNSPIVGMAANTDRRRLLARCRWWRSRSRCRSVARFCMARAGAIELVRPIVRECFRAKTGEGYRFLPGGRWLASSPLVTLYFHGSGPGRGFSESFAGMIPDFGREAATAHRPHQRLR